MGVKILVSHCLPFKTRVVGHAKCSRDLPRLVIESVTP